MLWFLEPVLICAYVEWIAVSYDWTALENDYYV